MSSVPPPWLAFHERRATWARLLRPRLVEAGVDCVETRSTADLTRALAGRFVPLVLIDASERPASVLDALAAVSETAPDALTLVLAPQESPPFDVWMRELGATRAWLGPARPPAVHDCLLRWSELARRRASADGWLAGADMIRLPPWWPPSLPADLAPLIVRNRP